MDIATTSDVRRIRTQAHPLFMQIEDILGSLVDAAVERALASSQEAVVGFLDVEGAARFLSLSEEAVRTLAKRHKIPRVTLPNGRVRFDDALRAWATGAVS